MKAIASILLPIAGILPSQAASAQQEAAIMPQDGAAPSQTDHGWKLSLNLSLSPRLGEGIGTDDGTELQEENEGEASISLTHGEGIRRFALQVGATAAPVVVTDGDPESAYYVEAAVGDGWVPYSQVLGQRAYYISRQNDRFRPYAKYRFSSAYSNLFDARLHDDHTISAGVRFRDVRRLMSDTSTKGLYWEGRVELSSTFSDDDDYDTRAARVQADVYSQPFGGGIRVYGSARGDFTFFRADLTPANRRREDQRLRLEAGLELSEWAQTRIGHDAQAAVGLQFQRRWSNDPEARHTRIYAVPSLSIEIPFG